MNTRLFAKVSMLAMPVAIASCLLLSGRPAMAQVNFGDWAQGQSNLKHCSDRTLSGDYVYAVNGTAVTIPPVGPVAILGKITLDGKGSFSGSVNGSIAGAFILTDTPVTGTYSVASDCTGTLTTVYPAFTAHFSLVLVEGVKGKKAELVGIDVGTVATGTVKP